MIERVFDIPFVADLASREKQIQQNYRPIIAVHKWFARRPGTLFRSLLLSEFAQDSLAASFYKANDLKGLRIADPFMGGGTPLLEANRLGCDIVGFDINPMAYWIVKEEIEYLDLEAYQAAASTLRGELADRIGHLYRTTCLECGSTEASVKYFLWVKVQACTKCGQDIDLFPGYVLSENRRHPRNVIVCHKCGELTETDDLKEPGKCGQCGAKLLVQGPAKRSLCLCPHCGASNRFPTPHEGAPVHRMFAIEYNCSSCKSRHLGRFFKKPDSDDLARFKDVESKWRRLRPRFVPDEGIPSGDETDRLHRWGYKYYRDMFNERQLTALELSCRIIAEQPDLRIRNALATNLSDLLRYQNMLCRYDAAVLKSLDIFSVHGFPVGLVQCESNFLGISNGHKGINIGSGGWSNIIDKFTKAKSYCYRPFEFRHKNNLKVQVPIVGEWIGDHRNVNSPPSKRVVDLFCANAGGAELPPASLDGVFTDPPYFGNVQYAELMDFCYVWLRRLVGADNDVFSKASTRHPDELTGNKNMGRGLDHFAEGLSTVFSKMARALKPGAPFAFTYHHNSLDAYLPVAVAMLDSGLTCSASLPCPAEMSASIHINGTGSSVVDTIFVCRSTGTVRAKWLADSPESIAGLVREDAAKLSGGNVRLTHGDVRCIIFGHLTRLAVWYLRRGWERERSTRERLQSVTDWLEKTGGLTAVQEYLADVLESAPKIQKATTCESKQPYGTDDDEIAF